MPEPLAPPSTLPWSKVLIVVLVCVLFAGGLMLLVINLPTSAPTNEQPFPATDPITLPTPTVSPSP